MPWYYLRQCFCIHFIDRLPNIYLLNAGTEPTVERKGNNYILEKWKKLKTSLKIIWRKAANLRF